MEGVQRPVKIADSVVEAEPVPVSEFMQAVVKAGDEKAWAVMDELMSTLQAVNRRLYDGVMRQLTES